MKGKTGMLVALVLVVALLTALVPLPALAGGNKTSVAGDMVRLPTPPDFLARATTRVLGNGRVRIYEWILVRDEVSDARLCGLETQEFNLIVDFNTGSGPVWGSVEIENTLGSWSGEFAGRVDNFTFTWHVTLVGSGSYKGLVAHLGYTGYQDGTIEDPDFKITGYIIETGAYRGPGMVCPLPRTSEPGGQIPGAWSWRDVAPIARVPSP